MSIRFGPGANSASSRNGEERFFVRTKFIKRSLRFEYSTANCPAFCLAVPRDEKKKKKQQQKKSSKNTRQTDIELELQIRHDQTKQKGLEQSRRKVPPTKFRSYSWKIKCILTGDFFGLGD